MLLENVRSPYMLILLVVVLLTGCSSNEKSVSNDDLLLMGESQTWNLTGYEVEITPEKFKAGNGTLQVKDGDNSTVDSYYFQTHIVINNIDLVVHGGGVSTTGGTITEESTGAIEGGVYMNEEGKPITLNEINAIYMTVEWWDKSERTKERIDLYTKPNEDHSFLN